MKKLITFVILFLIIILGIIYFIYGKEFLTIVDEKRVYNVENIQTISLSTLNEYIFYNEGIITYNNQKILFLDYNNNISWVNEDNKFSKQVFVTDNYIFRKMENTIQVLDKNNQEFIISEIQGDIIDVSRENDKNYMIVKGSEGKDSLYIMNSNNEMIVDNKLFEDKIIGVSISDKSEAYVLVTFRFENGTIVNTVYFNLLDDVELWKTVIDEEIIVNAKVVNNNVVVIGTKNVYYFNTNGKLMWKNSIYNKILDYEVNKESHSIYMLYEKDGSAELITYDFEGKVKEIKKLPSNVTKLKVYEDKVFVYNKISIYLVHGAKTDKIFEDTEGNIADFTAKGSDIRILSNDKLIIGRIK